MGFIFESFRILDLLDIILVAFLLYQVYLLIRGTVALNIFYGLFIIYLVWLLVRVLNMQLLGSILGQFIGLGLIALLIVFQQEVRRFLLILGTRYFRNSKWSLDNLFRFKTHDNEVWNLRLILDTCFTLGESKTGALIVLAKQSELRAFAETGQLIEGELSRDLLISIFQKGTPLHDGAVILVKNKIKAAGCVLPITDNQQLRGSLGMRHRAAVGMSENSDSVVLVVSEETGSVSLADQGQLIDNHSKEYLLKKLKVILKEDK
ncbi:MAG: diadenylate cyclase CdaA [Bacteroidales bacterium]|nr:diadenylate cyclase CdaA [Bacteroidales bacterium]